MEEAEIFETLQDEFGDDIITDHVQPVEEKKEDIDQQIEEAEEIEDDEEREEKIEELEEEKEEVPYSDSWIEVERDEIDSVCQFLKEAEDLQFNYLMCLSGVDWGDDELGVTYHLHSMKHGHKVTLKTFCPVDDPVVPTVSDVWGGANWHEREAFDMLGIRFEGHPYLKRLLCPEDWEGHPLRKDYEVQEYYRNVRVPY